MCGRENFIMFSWSDKLSSRKHTKSINFCQQLCGTIYRNSLVSFVPGFLVVSPQAFNVEKQVFSVEFSCRPTNFWSLVSLTVRRDESFHGSLNILERKKLRKKKITVEYEVPLHQEMTDNTTFTTQTFIYIFF